MIKANQTKKVTLTAKLTAKQHKLPPIYLSFRGSEAKPIYDVNVEGDLGLIGPRSTIVNRKYAKPSSFIEKDFDRSHLSKYDEFHLGEALGELHKQIWDFALARSEDRYFPEADKFPESFEITYKATMPLEEGGIE